MIISGMQSKLATWSTAEKERKFDRLLRLVADRTWLVEAARITLASSGAKTPGVDGVDKEMLEGNLPHELTAIHDELLAGTYQPLGAACLYPENEPPLGIPKPAGSDCAKGYADGDGAHMKERFPSGLIWIQTSPERTPCDTNGETAIARRR